MTDDHEIESPLKVDTGCNLDFVWNRRRCRTLGPEEPRTVNCIIMSWVGTAAINARHFYGRMSVRGPEVRYVGEDDGSPFWLSADGVPEAARSMGIRVTRIAPEDEPTNYYTEGLSPMFRVKKGQRTRCFDTPNQVRDRIIENFKSLFEGRWELHGKLTSFEDECHSNGITDRYGDDDRYKFHSVAYADDGVAHITYQPGLIKTIHPARQFTIHRARTKCGMEVREVGADWLAKWDIESMDVCGDCLKATTDWLREERE